MLIKKLYLKNFKCVEEQEFTFQKGIILISGDNGEGKSTIFNAINILLFNDASFNLKDYIRWDCDDFYISIEFENKGINYKETFSYSEKSGSKRILINLNTNEEWSNSVAIDKLDEIVNFEIAKSSIVSAEGEQNLISTTPSKRREFLKKVYDLDFKEQLERIDTDMKDSNENKVKLESEIAVMQSMTFDLKEKVNFNITEDEYNNCKKFIEKLNIEISELKSKKKDYDELLNSKSDINNSILSSQSKIKNLELKINEIDSKIKSFENSKVELDSVNSNIDKLSEELKLAEKEISDRTEIVNNFVDYDESEYKSISNKILELNTKIKMSNERLEIMKKGKCPVCGHEVTDAEVKNEENQIKLNTDEVEKLSANLSLEKKNIDENKSQKQRLVSELSESKLKLETLNRDISRFELKKTRIESEAKLVDEYQSQIKGYEQDIVQCNSDISLYESKLKSIDEKISNAENPIDAINKLQLEISKYENDCKIYDKIVSENEYIDKFNIEQIKKKSENEKLISEKKNKLFEEDARLSVMMKSKSILQKEFPAFVISHLVKKLENDMNELMYKVYPKFNITIKESKNSLSILYGEKECDVKQGSGFERSIFSISYMYALGKMQKYGLLLLDESDGTASDENSMKFFNALCKSQEYFPQIFLISHKKDVKDAIKNDFKAQCYEVVKGYYEEV